MYPREGTSCKTTGVLVYELVLSIHVVDPNLDDSLYSLMNDSQKRKERENKGGAEDCL